MSYTLEPPNPDRPFDPLVWNLSDDWAVEKKIGDLTLRMEKPQTVAVRFQNREHFINLSALELGQGKPILLEHLGQDQETFTQVLTAIPKLQSKYQHSSRYPKIELFYPTPMSRHICRMVITVAGDPAQASVQQDFSREGCRVNRLSSNQYEILCQRHVYRMREVLEVLSNQYGFVIDDAAQSYLYLCGRLEDALAHFHYGELSNPAVARWFNHQVNAMTAKEFANYCCTLRNKKFLWAYHGVRFDETLFSTRSKQVIDYLQCRSDKNIMRAEVPKMSQRMQMFLDVMDTVLMVTMFIALSPILLPALLLKGLARLLNPLSNTTVYESRDFPILFNLILYPGMLNGLRRVERVAVSGAIFDLLASLLLNVAALITAPIVLIPWLIRTLTLKIERHVAHKAQEKVYDAEVVTLNQTHPLFQTINQIDNIQTVSKGLQQLCAHYDGAKTKAPPPIPVQAELTEIPEANPSHFQFFSRLPRTCQEKIIHHAMDQTLSL